MGIKVGKKPYNESKEALKLLCQQSPESEELRRLLFSNLDTSPRASSLIENINGQLKRFLKSRRCFANQETQQNYLNLFVLWYNSHLFERGKRQGTALRVPLGEKSI